MSAPSAESIARARMRNQRLVGPPCADPAQTVAWLGAVQAQDFGGAKWALGMRTRNCTDAAVERAFEAGEILRTHVLRPTWHFVSPKDVRWLLALTAPRIRAALAYYDRKLEIDAKLLRRSRGVIEKALRGEKQLTRVELGRQLAKSGISADGQRLGHLMMHAELDAVICNGARRRKQFTYALLDERVPPVKELQRDEALAALSARYFTAHGPALAADFAWWSGLTVRDAQRGLEMVAADLVCETIDGKAYWQAPEAKKTRTPQVTIHLLPNYDEQLIAYKDRSAAFAAGLRAGDLAVRDGVFANQVVRNGQVIGSWRREREARAIAIDTKLRVSLTPVERDCLRAAAEAYGRFHALPVELASGLARVRT